jgi:SSS family solute:Na+ symporter
VPVVTLVAIWLTLRGGTAIVPLLLMGYSLVTQLMPAVLLSLWERPRATAAGAFAGILAGELVVAYLSITGASVSGLVPWAPQMIKDLNVGIVALVVNVLVLGAVSLVTRSPMRTT